jgi:hypothetical protein
VSRFAELVARAATMGMRWDLPADHEQVEKELQQAARDLDGEATDLDHRVHNLEVENRRLREGRKGGGRPVELATEGYALLAAMLLRQGIARDILLAALAEAFRATGSKRPARSAENVLKVAEERRKAL